MIVVNAEKVKVTGKKMDQKIYYNHSDYVGGMKETTLKEMMNKKPEKVIELAVKGMLPKGPLGRDVYKRQEFNYMIMQAYDFYALYQKYGCNLQFGGDDQWSNMLAGTELILSLIHI